ncbi:MAG: cytochrome ubiquinol oxidase subunit I, partial [Pseudomonadota bacterium]
RERDNVCVERHTPVEFAFTVSFHIIFPTISIGLAAFLAITEGLYLKTKDELYLRIYRFWLNIFAMSFAIGVVTGIVLSFEFGLGFAKFAQLAGPVIGPLIGLEVLTAFFLEAGFLGVMLFGMHRVGPKLHFFATCMVSIGTIISASWILAANSWMQTPDGVVWEDGKLLVTSWLDVIVNPSWPVRTPHMIMAAFLTGSFLVAGIGAHYLLKGQHLDFAKRTVSMGLGFATVLIAVQLLLGDLLYGKMVEHQPAKMQAAEGYWEEQSPSPAEYLWFIIPDEENERNVVQFGTPYLGSIWLTHSLEGRIEGLKNTPAGERPNMAWVFFSFRLMFVIAIAMFACVVISIYLRSRGRLYDSRWFHRILVVMTPTGVFATLGGWYTAEIGRQPYVIYGMLRTSDAVSPVPASTLLTTLIAFVCIYAVFMAAFLFFTARLIKNGPQDAALQSQARALQADPHSSRSGDPATASSKV